MAITKWSKPEKDLFDLHDEFNDTFNDLFDHLGMKDLTRRAAFSPRLDIREDTKKIYVSTELPGLTEKDVKIQIKNNVLTLSGEKKEEKKVQKSGYYSSERRYGRFERSVTLPSSVTTDKAYASFHNGVFTVEIAKSIRGVSKSKTIEVKNKK